MLKHIMLDIETLGLSPNSVILQIVAKEFNLNGQPSLITPFQCNINLNQPDRVVETGTLSWWLNQDLATIKTVINGYTQKSLVHALTTLNSWIYNIRTDNNIVIKFWCRGTNFDFTLLENAYKQNDIVIPWEYYELSDVRTFDALVPSPIRKQIKRKGIYHNALDDVEFQIEYVQACLNYLSKGGNYA